jgi:hypothetical protein
MIRLPAALLSVACSLMSLGCGRAALTSPPDSAAGDLQTPTAVLTDSAKALSGRWSCSGSIHGPDGSPSPSEVSLEIRLELDQAWLRTDFVALSGAHEYDFTSYRTFHPLPNQWVNVIVDNLGGHAVSSSDDGVTWTGESRGPMGGMQIRDLETLAAPGELTMRGQYSLDGKSWRTGYDLACRK